MDKNQIPMSEREQKNAQLAYEAAAQSMVLLKNEEQVLPLPKEGKLALFGIGAVRTVRGGTGSGDPFNGGLSGGGDVDIDLSDRYHIQILRAFQEAGYEIVTAERLEAYAQLYDVEKRKQSDNVMHTFTFPDEALTEEAVREYANLCDTAVYVISRNSGEGSDRKISDFSLSETEKRNLRYVHDSFLRTVVVLNVGGIIELTYLNELGIKGILLMGLAGQEGARAVRDVLNGTVNPSGRLTDTWGKSYGQYPAAATFAANDGNVELERYEEGIYVGYRYFDGFGLCPEYEFGYGLSYTTYDVSFCEAACENGTVRVRALVRNTGKVPGREVVQLYCSASETEMEMPVQELVGFEKTGELLPGESQEIRMEIPLRELAHFSEERVEYLLSRGTYHFRLGVSSRKTEHVFDLLVDETASLETVYEELPLPGKLQELSRKGRDGYCPKNKEQVTVLTVNSRELSWRDSRSPWKDEQVITYTTDPAYQAVMPYEKVKTVPKREISFGDLCEGTAALEEFVGQLSNEELAALNCGTGWGVSDADHPVIGGSSESVPGAAGETTHLLEQYGVPSVILADGPGGVRIRQIFEAENVQTGEKELCSRFCTAWPTGTLLAQSFDRALLRRVGEGFAVEMKEYGIAILLAPGMNIHRDPLCGRNFEYYSEDPLLTGEMGAAFTKGVQATEGVGVCIKHFACNNQETNRAAVDTWVGQRTLREIYLKGYEIAIRKAQPFSIMTSYNLLNGIPTADSYDLCTNIARGEWGFEGLIMTDWNGGSSTASKSMHAGNDLIMPGGSTKIRGIRKELELMEPEFDERGQVLMQKIYKVMPFHEAHWNSFVLSATGKETVKAAIAPGHQAEVQDGEIRVDGQPVYTKAAGRKEFAAAGGAAEIMQVPATTKVAELSEDGKYLIYKGDYQRRNTICRGDLQRCAMNILKILIKCAGKGQ